MERGMAIVDARTRQRHVTVSNSTTTIHHLLRVACGSSCDYCCDFTCRFFRRSFSFHETCKIKIKQKTKPPRFTNWHLKNSMVCLVSFESAWNHRYEIL